mmetsp:Transcript_50678/g.58105  ORF Transcript_50678/g.58105 Transcript_50678/m.58105 type:complete len:94 (+) Transcript_50678:102-383(+)
MLSGNLSSNEQTALSAAQMAALSQVAALGVFGATCTRFIAPVPGIGVFRVAAALGFFLGPKYFLKSQKDAYLAAREKRWVTIDPRMDPHTYQA